MLGAVIFVLPAFQWTMECSGVAISDYSLEAVLSGDSFDFQAHSIANRLFTLCSQSFS